MTNGEGPQGGIS